MLTTGRPAAEYNNRVTIQQNTPTTDTNGQLLDSWATYATRWARIDQVTGQEHFKNHRLKEDVSQVVMLRHDSLTKLITPQMRIVWGSSILAILAAYDAETRQIEMHCLCKQRT